MARFLFNDLRRRGVGNGIEDDLAGDVLHFGYGQQCCRRPATSRF